MYAQLLACSARLPNLKSVCQVALITVISLMPPASPEGLRVSFHWIRLAKVSRLWADIAKQEVSLFKQDLAPSAQCLAI